jgi:hypothetical protein
MDTPGEPTCSINPFNAIRDGEIPLNIKMLVYAKPVFGIGMSIAECPCVAL